MNQDSNETIFKNTDTQNSAISQIVKSPATNVMAYGSSRSGKSFMIMRIILIRAGRTKSDHLITRATFNSAKTSIWQKTLPDVLKLCFPLLPIKWNNTDYFITLPNGSTVKIAGLDDKDKLERLLGTEYSTLWANEANQIAYPAITKLKTRLAQKNELKKMIFFDQNPTTTSSALYQLFEQGINPIDGEALSKEDRTDYLSIQMNIQGNLENVDEKYLSMLEKLPIADRKRFLLGEYSADNTGAAVYAFNRESHVSEEVKRLAGTVLIGSDFNIDFNSDVIGSISNTLDIWDEVQIAGDTFKKSDALIRKGCIGANVTCDYSGGNRRTSGKSDVIILRDAGFTVQAVPNPYVVDKIANLNRAFTLGLIRINPRCKKLIRDLTLLTWDKHGQLDQKTDPSLSHLVDGLAYLVWRLFPLTGKTTKIGTTSR